MVKYAMNADQYVCNRCKGEPFDIFNEWSLDTISLKICGECCDVGIRKGCPSATGKGTYLFPLEAPDYADREAMLDSLLNNTYVYRRFLILKLDRMVFEEKYFNS